MSQAAEQDPLPLSTDRPSGKGLAVGALVLGILGFVPLLGVLCAGVGLTLGIVALSKAQDRKGLAIAGTTVSALTLVLSCVITVGGLLLPAIGKARQEGRQA